MLVGWGGNNGTTVTAACLANKLGLSWHTKEGVRQPDYFGSITQASTVLLGNGPQGELHVPFYSLLPMVHPNSIIFDGNEMVIISLRLTLIPAVILNCEIWD